MSDIEIIQLRPYQLPGRGIKVQASYRDADRQHHAGEYPAQNGKWCARRDAPLFIAAPQGRP